MTETEKAENKDCPVTAVNGMTYLFPSLSRLFKNKLKLVLTVHIFCLANT